MRAFMDAKTFSDALGKVSKALKKSTVPVLEGVLVRFENGYCTLTGTDFTTWLTVKFPARGEAFAFVFQKPLAVVKACRYFEGEMALEICEDQLKYPNVTLACGRRTGTFDAFPEKDYPELPKQGETIPFTANANALLKRIERVKYAVRETKGFSYRADQTCVQFCGNDVFCLDGCRAACDKDAALTFPKPFLAWGDSLSHLKLMGSRDATVLVGEKHIWFCSDAVTLCCQKEGVNTFRLEDAVPTSFQEEFYVSPKAFLRELDYLEGFQPKCKSAVRFCGGRMTLRDIPERCFTTAEIEGVSEIAFGFDLRFMRDALKQFGGEKRVKIKISGANTPIIVEAEGRGDFAMVLPVRLYETKAA